jgi:hypothetical protein
MFPFLDFLTVLMEPHCLLLFYRRNPFWQNFFPTAFILILVMVSIYCLHSFQLRVVLSHTQQSAHLDARSLVTRYVKCQQHTPVTLLPSTNEFASAPQAIWKTVWKNAFLSDTRLLAVQHIVNHFNL